MRQWKEEGVKVQTCVTSPPYFGLRDYGVEGQIGNEQTPSEYVEQLVQVFRDVRQILHDDGTLWLNLGDSYTPVNYGPNAKRRQDSCGSEETLQGKVGHWHSDRDSARSDSLFRGARDEGYKQKDLMGMPWRVAFALQADGWYLRQDIVWNKPNPMPESVKDRCTKSHEYVFLLSKSPKYFFDSQAIREPAVMKPQKRNTRAKYEAPGAGEHRKGTQYLREEVGLDSPDGLRNKRSVWNINTKPYKGAHFAVFPTALVEPCVLAGSRPGDIVLDPFMGSGTTAEVALTHGRQYLGCELNPEYKELQDQRIQKVKEI